MAKYTRANAWNHGGTFDNQDLLWYAKGVGAMQARALNDTSSWWFFGAIHGEYVTPKSLRDPNAFPWKDIPAPVAAPTTPLPATTVSNQYWNQCQHQSWFFPPWHRGYLLALEAQVRAAVVKLGGPDTWALPYWNYLGPDDQFNIPPAFTATHLPDGTPNPLFATARYGADSDGNIYIPTAAGEKQHPNDPNFGSGEVTQECLLNDLYTGSDTVTKLPGYGGPQTGFSHGGRASGNLEDNPHNLVHVYVGGVSPDGEIPGLMSVPALAALDPIFYLHHCNIDRLWAVWNEDPKNTNPTVAAWSNGPAAAGKNEFVMPMPGGKAWVFTPQQVTSLAPLSYTYDDLTRPAPAPSLLTQRLTRLGAAANIQEGVAVPQGNNTELVGASQVGLQIKGAGASTTVKLDESVRQKVSTSITEAPQTLAPDRVYLHLEGVRGSRDASVLSVYVNLPEGAKPGDHPELLAGSVGLFGLREASFKDGEHGGEGLDFVLDMTKIADGLQSKNQLDADSLKVTVVPRREVPDEKPITVGRISIYRQGN